MKILLVILAGLLGGLVNSLGIWAGGALGLNQVLGFNFAPALTIPWLLPRLISSGLWGLLFLLPFWRDKEDLLEKGTLLSIAPLAMMLFVMFPKMGAGLLGVKLGATAPIFALFFTIVWGLTAALFLKTTNK